MDQHKYLRLLITTAIPTVGSDVRWQLEGANLFEVITFAMLSIDSGIGQRGEEMSKNGITERESEVYRIFNYYDYAQKVLAKPVPGHLSSTPPT
jgi:hypothetical protein